MTTSFFALGVSIPVMSLIVTSKGYPLHFLGLAMVVLSLTVMIFELPSGVFADAKGRKPSFILGTCFSLFGTLLLFGQHYGLICLGFGFSGLGRAYGSGSLDALYIEKGQQNGAKLEDLVFSLDLVSGLGLSIGSLFGGFLLSLGVQGPHLTHPVLLARLTLLSISLVLASVGIKESPAGTDQKRTFWYQLKEFRHVLQDTPFLIYLSFSILVQGMLLSSLESYWQPFLKQLLDDGSQLWILGMVSALVFAVSLLGSFLGKLLLRLGNSVGLYSLTFCSLFCLQAVLSFQNSMTLFILIFCIIYLLIGLLSVVGMFILNKTAKDEVRTSLISLSSFSLQSGGVLSNIIATFVLGIGGIALFWNVSALLGLIIVLMLTKPLLQRFPRTGSK